jgi:LacI family transcriptional regulator
LGHPIVGASAAEGYHVVTVPNEELATELARTLAEVHRGDFVIAGGPEGLLTSDDRIRGYQAGLATAGRPPAEVLRAGFDRTGGYQAGLTLAKRITSAKKATGAPVREVSRPCILAANDVMAIGAVAAFRSEGLRIPRDALIAGFDDIETLRDFRPTLSTVHLPLEEIGRLAALGGTCGPIGANDGFSVEGQIILRRSTEILPPPRT